MTTVRLALGGTAKRIAMSLRKGQGPDPAILVSFVYYEGSFHSLRGNIGYRDWVLDSGAFTAHASGKPIELSSYAEFCTHVLAWDETLSEVFSLDVIGDWKATLKNTEQLWSLGIPAIPTYHAGQPADALMVMARDYPKIAFGGAVGLKPKAKVAFAQQAMARVWPKPVHGFGFGTLESMLAVPFHSTDATNWELGPSAFGNWQFYKGKLDYRNKLANYRCEVDVNLEWERQARWRWQEVLPEVADEYEVYQRALAKARREAA